MAYRAPALRGLMAFVVATAVAGSLQVATAAKLMAAAERSVAGTVTGWSTGKFTVKDRSGNIHQFTTDRTTKIEGQPKVGSRVEVVSLQEGPLAVRVKVLAPAPSPRPKTVTGVIKNWSSERVTLEVSGKMMEFKTQGDFAKLQEGPLAKPVGRKVEVTYDDDQTESVKIATKVIVDKKS